ncbi:TlpA family protein disulfide reductase [Affinibrenneria salicis]|uniref:TlpA family protein disulfide reductase n=2 Tax=Affinibrenneria salicis TaxID=2590031 RepID=A0A5J5G257_9GAMM|nr:TlpA family protein disulfide reductase [Affinibrenneria salicis]
MLGGCKEERASVGQPAPALAAWDLQGQQVDLNRWQGKNVYLNFWSAGCGGCLAEMATLAKLSKQYGDRIVVVAINTDPESVDIQPLLQQQKIDYPVVRDQLGISKERYQVIGTPTSFLINAQGKVLEQHQGSRNEQALSELFRRVAQGV